MSSQDQSNHQWKPQTNKALPSFAIDCVRYSVTVTDSWPTDEAVRLQSGTGCPEGHFLPCSWAAWPAWVPQLLHQPCIASSRASPGLGGQSETQREELMRERYKIPLPDAALPPGRGWSLLLLGIMQSLGGGVGCEFVLLRCNLLLSQAE